MSYWYPLLWGFENTIKEKVAKSEMDWIGFDHTFRASCGAAKEKTDSLTELKIGGIKSESR